MKIKIKQNKRIINVLVNSIEIKLIANLIANSNHSVCVIFILILRVSFLWHLVWHSSKSFKDHKLVSSIIDTINRQTSIKNRLLNLFIMSETNSNFLSNSKKKDFLSNLQKEDNRLKRALETTINRNCVASKDIWNSISFNFSSRKESLINKI